MPRSKKAKAKSGSKKKVKVSVTRKEEKEERKDTGHCSKREFKELGAPDCHCTVAERSAWETKGRCQAVTIEGHRCCRSATIRVNLRKRPEGLSRLPWITLNCCSFCRQHAAQQLHVTALGLADLLLKKIVGPNVLVGAQTRNLLSEQLKSYRPEFTLRAKN